MNSERSGREGSWDWSWASEVCLVEARRVLGHGHDAEEAAQEALLRAWRRRASCRSPAAQRAWLATIARREALRVGERPNRPILRSEPPDRGADDPSLEGVERSVALTQALGFLAQEEQALLSLRYVEDLTQPQVADVLGVPEGTVKVRLHRLRHRLRRSLEGWGQCES